MHTKITLFMLFVALAAAAQTNTNTRRPVRTAKAKPAATAPRRVSSMVERQLPGEAFLVLDTRGVQESWVTNTLAEIKSFCRILCKIEHTTPPDKKITPLKIAQNALQKQGGKGVVVVLIKGEPQEPGLTLYPENKIAIINTTPYSAGADEKLTASRLNREVWRALGYVGGGVETPEYCVIKTVLQPSDLDALEPSTFSPGVAINIQGNAEKTGLSRVERAPYRVACMRGWAPPPTNDTQRAIWQAVKEQAK